MEPAPDVRDAYLHFTKALSSGDASSLVGTFSRMPGVIEIGSAPDAWSEGSESITNRLTAVMGRRLIEEALAHGGRVSLGPRLEH